MHRLRIGLFVCALIWTLMPGISSAQEFRVYTLVYDDRPNPASKGERAEPVSRCLSLFHAGRVYDYLPAQDEQVLGVEIIIGQ